MAVGRAGPGEGEHGTARDAGELPGVERGVRGDDDHAGPGLGGRPCALRSRRPGGEGAPEDSQGPAEVGLHEGAHGEPAVRDLRCTGGRPDAGLEPGATVPVPAPAHPSPTGPADAPSSAARTCSSRTGRLLMSDRKPSLHSHDGIETQHALTSGLFEHPPDQGVGGPERGQGGGEQHGVSSSPSSASCVEPMSFPYPFPVNRPAGTGAPGRTPSGTTAVTPLCTPGRDRTVACPTRTPGTSVRALSGPVGTGPTTMPRSRARGRGWQPGPWGATLHSVPARTPRSPPRTHPHGHRPPVTSRAIRRHRLTPPGKGQAQVGRDSVGQGRQRARGLVVAGSGAARRRQGLRRPGGVGGRGPRDDAGQLAARRRGTGCGHQALSPASPTAPSPPPAAVSRRSPGRWRSPGR